MRISPMAQIVMVSARCEMYGDKIIPRATWTYPPRNVAETTPKLAAVQVKKPPNIAIIVRKPPSVWSRFRDIWSSTAAKSPAVQEPAAAPAERNVHFAESTTSTGFPERRPDSPQIKANGHPASQHITCATCACNKRGANSPGPSGSDGLSEESSSSATDDVYEPAYSGSRSPKESVRVDELKKCRCEATPRIQRNTDSTAVARIAVDKHVKCRSYGLCRRLTDESNYLGLSNLQRSSRRPERVPLRLRGVLSRSSHRHSCDRLEGELQGNAEVRRSRGQGRRPTGLLLQGGAHDTEAKGGRQR
ncbi:hypothetical protein MTO96_005278 [Rhipicephalus appendiculatus]